MSHRNQGEELIRPRDALRTRRVKGIPSMSSFFSTLAECTSFFTFSASLVHIAECGLSQFESTCWPLIRQTTLFSLGASYRFLEKRIASLCLCHVRLWPKWLLGSMPIEREGSSFQNNTGADGPVVIKTPQDDDCPSINPSSAQRLTHQFFLDLSGNGG